MKNMDLVMMEMCYFLGEMSNVIDFTVDALEELYPYIRKWACEYVADVKLSKKDVCVGNYLFGRLMAMGFIEMHDEDFENFEDENFSGVLEHGSDFNMGEICNCHCTLNYCEQYCNKYYECEKVAMANDILKKYECYKDQNSDENQDDIGLDLLDAMSSNSIDVAKKCSKELKEDENSLIKSVIDKINVMDMYVDKTDWSTHYTFEGPKELLDLIDNEYPNVTGVKIWIRAPKAAKRLTDFFCCISPLQKNNEWSSITLSHDEIKLLLNRILF